MKPVLSVLDPSPIFEGRTATDSLADTRALAAECEAMGYASYWVQEHHNTPCFASVAPEVLIADLAARTTRIGIGAGGVMLANYSPLKVAEQFSTLSALHPGRIELGIGRATGADPRASAALLGPGAESFPQMLRLLMDWLLDASGKVPLAADHRAHGIRARPSAPIVPVRGLVSSAEAAAFIGAMGLPMVYADFLAPGHARPAISAYRAAFTPSPFAPAPSAAIAFVAMAAESDEAAEREAAPAAAWNVLRAAGRFAPFPGRDLAEAILSRIDAPSVAQARSRAIVGSAPSVARTLQQRCSETGAEEVFLLTIAERLETRIASYRLIMAAMDDHMIAKAG